MAMTPTVVLEFIVSHRGAGTSMARLFEFLGAEGEQEREAVEQVVAQLEEDADVYREGPDMLFPI